MMKRIIPFVFAAVMGLGAVAGLQWLLRTERSKLARERQQLLADYKEPVDVLVAGRDIAEGATVSAEDLDHRAVPLKFVEPYATSQAADLLGLVAMAPIAEGEQVLTNKLRRSEERAAGATLSTLTPEGKRAVTIGTDALTGVGGYVRPGDAVDVLWTFQVPQPGGQTMEPVTMTLFQSVTVLAVGDEMIGQSTGQKAAGTDYTVTLAMTPQEAALLLYAREQGRVQLSLRPPTDKDTQVAVAPASMASVMESVLGPTQGQQPAKLERTVEVFKGLERTVVAVTSD